MYRAFSTLTIGYTICNKCHIVTCLSSTIDITTLTQAERAQPTQPLFSPYKRAGEGGPGTELTEPLTRDQD